MTIIGILRTIPDCVLLSFSAMDQTESKYSTDFLSVSQRALLTWRLDAYFQISHIIGLVHWILQLFTVLRYGSLSQLVYICIYIYIYIYITRMFLCLYHGSSESNCNKPLYVMYLLCCSSFCDCTRRHWHELCEKATKKSRRTMRT